jgi:hypothetical protein
MPCGRWAIRSAAVSVGRLLCQMGYSLQANAKLKEGKQHPDRDAQFAYLNDQVKQHQAVGAPVLSVDTKKKELVGEFKIRRQPQLRLGERWHRPRHRQLRGGDASGGRRSQSPTASYAELPEAGGSFPLNSVMTSSGQLPFKRWTAPSVLSQLLAVAAVAFIVIGLFSRRLVPVLLGATALVGPIFAAISIGWALDYKLPRVAYRWRARLMQWFFMLVGVTLLILAVVDRTKL